MWTIVASNKIIMSEGDFNISLPFTIVGVTIESTQHLKIIIKDASGNAKIARDLPYQTSPINYNEVNLTLTSTESATLVSGDYRYSLIWYDSSMQCTLIDDAEFLVR